MMMTKIHKAKLITLHNQIEDRSDSRQAEDLQHRSIHTYFALLKHIFQRNKQTIKRSARPVAQSRNTIKKNQPAVTRNTSKDEQLFGLTFHQLHQSKNLRSDNKKATLSNQQFRYGLIKRQKQMSQDYNGEKTNFIPIGKIYNNLKKSVETDQAKYLQKTCLKLTLNNFAAKKKLSLQSRYQHSSQKMNKNTKHRQLKKAKTERQSKNDDELDVRMSYKSYACHKVDPSSEPPTPW